MDSKKNTSVSSTQSGSMIKDFDLDVKLMLKVFEAWKAKAVNKTRRYSNDKNSILKFLRLRKKFLMIVLNEKEKRMKTKIFTVLRCFSKSKPAFSYVFLRKFLGSWKRFAGSLKKSYKASYIIQEKSFGKCEKKFFCIWRKRFLVQRRLSRFIKLRLGKRLKLIFFSLKQAKSNSANQRKSLNRLITRLKKSNLQVLFSKWSRYSSKHHQNSLKLEVQNLKKSNFLQSQQISRLQSQLSSLNESLQQTFDIHSNSKSEISILLSKHAEELYKALCS